MTTTTSVHVPALLVQDLDSVRLHHAIAGFLAGLVDLPERLTAWISGSG